MRTLSKPALVAERGDCLGAAVYLGEVVRFPGDGGNGDELGEGLQGCFEVFGDGVAQGALWWVNSVVMFLPYPTLAPNRRAVGFVSVAGVGLWGRVWCVPFGYDGRVFGQVREG